MKFKVIKIKRVNFDQKTNVLKGDDKKIRLNRDEELLQSIDLIENRPKGVNVNKHTEISPAKSISL